MDGTRRRRLRQEVPPAVWESWTLLDRARWLQKHLRDIPLAEIGLPVRVVNTLEKRGIFMAGELLLYNRDRLAGIQNFGDKTFRQILAICRDLGLDVPDDWRKRGKLPKRKSREIDKTNKTNKTKEIKHGRRRKRRSAGHARTT